MNRQRTAPVRRFQVYRLRDGDTLPKLALRFLGNERRAIEIWEANRHILSHPEILPLNIEIRIPQDD